MIGALIAKSVVSAGFDYLNKGDVSSLISRWADDATLTYPGKMPASGVFKGKKAIEKWFHRFIEVFPKRHFTVKSVGVQNIFDFTGTNIVTAEWDVIVMNHEGKDFRNNGVTVINSIKGRAISVCDYYFDVDAPREAWKR